jgi:hypothetical protein
MRELEFNLSVSERPKAELNSRNSMSKGKWQARTKQDLIVEVWEHLDCESVGADELEQIQREIGDQFGRGAIESPAAIARTLADEGAVLRHPEILICDTRWRESRVAEQDHLDFSTLQTAQESIQKLELARQKEEGSGQDAQKITEMALQIKKQVQLRARSKIVDGRERMLAKEIAQWLTVWLTQPDLFEDWLSLRLRSPEFVEKFGMISAPGRISATDEHG